MKKGIAIGALVLFVGLTSGCGSKTLTCTDKMDEDGSKIETTFKASFDSNGKELKKISMKYDIEVDEKYKDDLDDLYEMFLKEMDDYEDIDGVKVKESKKDTKANISMTVNVAKLSKSDKEKLEMEELDKSYDDVKKYYEDMDYTCK